MNEEKKDNGGFMGAVNNIIGKDDKSEGEQTPPAPVQPPVQQTPPPQNNTEGENKPAPTPITEGNTQETKKDEVQNIAEDTTKAPQTESPMNQPQTNPFDFSKMSKENLQMLKDALRNTPDGISMKSKKPIIKMRMIDGKLVTSFTKAFNAMRFDDAEQKKVQVHMMHVTLDGEGEPREITYRQFRESEQIECEVIKMLKEDDPVVVGETISEETKLLVEMVVNYQKTYFTVKLPDGNIMKDVNSDLINA